MTALVLRPDDAIAVASCPARQSEPGGRADPLTHVELLLADEWPAGAGRDSSILDRHPGLDPAALDAAAATAVAPRSQNAGLRAARAQRASAKRRPAGFTSSFRAASSTPNMEALLRRARVERCRPPLVESALPAVTIGDAGHAVRACLQRRQAVLGLFARHEHFVELRGIDQPPQQEVDHRGGRPEVAEDKAKARVSRQLVQNS